MAAGAASGPGRFPAAARSKAEFDEPLARTSLGLPAEAPAAPASPGAAPAQ